MSTGLVNRKRALNAIKQIDAFPKVQESYQQTTASGGGVTLIVFGAISFLVISEIQYYTATEFKYKYQVDHDYESKLKIDIDMTVAMPCQSIGADVLDMTGNSQHHTHDTSLIEEDVFFELSPAQRHFFDMLQNINSYIREEYHAMHDVLWRAGFGGIGRNKPAREDKPEGKPDGCRLHGVLAVNKVAGNFHITAGKIKVQSFGSDSHAHLALGIKDSEYNFSHRIDRFAFGDYVQGIINPLDGEEKVTQNNYHLFQYFMQVVPTEVNTRLSQVSGYQYAVTEKNRTIDHKSGSHGVPGIFVKYDLSALKVSVLEQHRPYWKFLVTLCGIVGGIVQVSGILHGLVGLLVDALLCRWSSCKKPQASAFSASPPSNPLSTAPYTSSDAHINQSFVSTPIVTSQKMSDYDAQTPLLQQQPL